MKNYNKILRILHDKFDWRLTNSLTEQGKKLVSDTLKANEILNNQVENTNNWFQNMPLYARYLYYLIGGIFIGYLISKM